MKDYPDFQVWTLEDEMTTPEIMNYVSCTVRLKKHYNDVAMKTTKSVRSWKSFIAYSKISYIVLNR